MPRIYPLDQGVISCHQAFNYLFNEAAQRGGFFNRWIDLRVFALFKALDRQYAGARLNLNFSQLANKQLVRLNFLVYGLLKMHDYLTLVEIEECSSVHPDGIAIFENLLDGFELFDSERKFDELVQDCFRDVTALLAHSTTSLEKGCEYLNAVLLACEHVAKSLAIDLNKPEESVSCWARCFPRLFRDLLASLPSISAEGLSSAPEMKKPDFLGKEPLERVMSVSPLESSSVITGEKSFAEETLQSTGFSSLSPDSQDRSLWTPEGLPRGRVIIPLFQRRLSGESGTTGLMDDRRELTVLPPMRVRTHSPLIYGDEALSGKSASPESSEKIEIPGRPPSV